MLLGILIYFLLIAEKKTHGIGEQHNLSFHLKKEIRVIHSQAIRSKGGRFELLTTYLNMMSADTLISFIFTAMDFLHMR